MFRLCLLISLLLCGCATSRVSNILPPNFPFLKGVDPAHNYNEKLFRIYFYDTDKDSRVDLELWYFIVASETDPGRDVTFYKIAVNPAIIKRITDGIVTLIEFDYNNDGLIDETLDVSVDILDGKVVKKIE